MRAIVPPVNVIGRRKCWIGECAARDNNGAGEVCSGLREAAATADPAKGFHHIRRRLALRKPNGIVSGNDPHMFLPEPHIMCQCAAGCTLAARAGAYVIVDRFTIDLQGQGAAAAFGMKDGHLAHSMLIRLCRSYGAGIDSAYQKFSMAPAVI